MIGLGTERSKSHAGRLSAGFIVALLVVAGGIVRGQSKIETETQNRTLVQASFDAWGAGTGSPFDLLAEDATWTIVGRSLASKTYPTRDAFMTEVIRPFNARMRVPLKPSIRQLHADGDTVIILFDASGTARDGEPYTNTYAWFLEMRHGKVIRASAFFDSIVFNDLWRRVAPGGAQP